MFRPFHRRRVTPPASAAAELKRRRVREPGDSHTLSVNDSVGIHNAWTIAHYRMPERGHTPDTAGENVNYSFSRYSPRRMYAPELRKQEFQDWLNSAGAWKQGLANGWEGVRILGRGGNGIAGLWRYVGLDNENTQFDKQLEYIVIKQMRPRGTKGLRKEVSYSSPRF